MKIYQARRRAWRVAAQGAGQREGPLSQESFPRLWRLHVAGWSHRRTPKLGSGSLRPLGAPWPAAVGHEVSRRCGERAGGCRAPDRPNEFNLFSPKSMSRATGAGRVGVFVCVLACTKQVGQPQAQAQARAQPQPANFGPAESETPATEGPLRPAARMNLHTRARKLQLSRNKTI